MLYIQATAQTSVIGSSSSGKLTSYFDPRLLNHYTEAELSELQAAYPDKYQTALYYYTGSYMLELTDCNNCVPVNPSTFDIAPYEHLRKKSERAVHDFEKHGFRLILLATDELAHKLPIHLIEP